MESEPERLVEAGYDTMADRHLAWIEQIEGDPRLRFLEDFARRLPARPAVLDLGCGPGVPNTARLVELGADVVGVDISARQIELARKHVPTARFDKADISTVEFPAESFDGVTAFYSIAHVPRDRHAGLFGRIASWLRPGGQLLASLACTDDPGTVETFLGTPMFFNGHEAPTNSRLIRDAGLRIVTDEAITMQEPEGPSTFQWIVAAKAR